MYLRARTSRSVRGNRIKVVSRLDLTRKTEIRKVGNNKFKKTKIKRAFRKYGFNGNYLSDYFYQSIYYYEYLKNSYYANRSTFDYGSLMTNCGLDSISGSCFKLRPRFMTFNNRMATLKRVTAEKLLVFKKIPKSKIKDFLEKQKDDEVKQSDIAQFIYETNNKITKSYLKEKPKQRAKNERRTGFQ